MNKRNHILETAIFQCDLQLLPPTFWFNSPRMSMIAVYFTSNGKMSTGQTANSTSTTWRHASMALCFARNISLTRLRSTECFSSTRSSYKIKIVYFQNFIGRQFISSEINLSPIISPISFSTTFMFFIWVYVWYGDFYNLLLESHFQITLM